MNLKTELQNLTSEQQIELMFMAMIGTHAALRELTPKAQGDLFILRKEQELEKISQAYCQLLEIYTYKTLPNFTPPMATDSCKEIAIKYPDLWDLILLDIFG